MSLRARLDDALTALAKERAARAKAEATDVGDVYAAYQADRVSLTEALELGRSERAALAEQLSVTTRRALAAEEAVHAAELARSDLESALHAHARDAQTFAASAAELRAEKEALDARCAGLAAEFESVQSALSAHSSALSQSNASLAASQTDVERLQSASMQSAAQLQQLQREADGGRRDGVELRRELASVDDERQVSAAQASSTLYHPSAGGADGLPQRGRGASASTAPPPPLSSQPATFTSHALTCPPSHLPTSAAPRASPAAQALLRERQHLSELLRAERQSSASTRAELEELSEAANLKASEEAALRSAVEEERRAAMALGQARRQSDAEVARLSAQVRDCF